jgi:ankyrin repeat protein
MTHLVKLLLERGTDINAETIDGGTALTLPVANKHVQLAAYLRTVGRGH